MVLIITNPVERQRWNDHLQQYRRERQVPHVDAEVIRLSKYLSSSQIKKEITISNERFITVRGRARRQGLL